ncbi:ABC transporter ATP-binding protein/permease [Candidatus Binatia bacterium]|nr:ABC transporter ATP-binding protein/permease [Candidatus Binatia bacterium]
MRRLWRYLRPYQRTFWMSVAILPVISGLMLLQPYLLKVAIDRYVDHGDTSGLGRIATLFSLAVVGEFFAVYWQYYLTMVVAQHSLADLRVDLFAHLERLPQRYFDRNPVGRIVTRLTTDVDVLSEMFASGAMTIFMDALTLLGIVSIMLWIDWRLALVALSVVPVVIVTIDFFRKRARVTYRLIRERIARINSFLSEAISGMPVIQLFAHERASFAEFDEHNAAHRDANHLSNVYEAALFSIIEAVSSIAMALVVWYGSGQIVKGVVAFGTLVAFIEYIQKFFIPIRDFSTKYAVMQSAITAAERVFQLLDTPHEIVSPAAPRRVAADDPERGAVRFENVWFAYKGEDWVLRDVSLDVRPGETVAIVGATGSGKSTIIKLLGRSFDVKMGSVQVSGVDVREWDLAELRREIGIVLQDAFLFTGTLASNVTLGRAEVSDETLRATVRAVNLERFVSSLPLGYAQPIRERGNNLSAGQRQLLAFARALAYDPRILVLDEATSSVDAETEQLVQEALDRLLRGRTAIVIAHRLSTIERADRIVVLHHGVVREVGTHAELLALGQIYARLYELQYAGGRSNVGADATDDGASAGS